MATQGAIVEGIFAVNKPTAKSSGQLVRDVQDIFNRSRLFRPWLTAERANVQHQVGRRKRKHVQVKVGHGGTLDPMATGVMIIGVGKGTKRLGSFLECTKSYEATVLFGAATDSYDIEGKVLKRAPYKYLTREGVEEALQGFRGKIMQRPPIYSALKMDGKRLCDYAREGKEIPREIVERPVEVKELEITEWLEGGQHDFSVRNEEADSVSKEVAETVLHLGENGTAPVKERQREDESMPAVGTKRKSSPDDAEDEAVTNKRPALSQEQTDPSTLMSGGLPPVEQEQSPDGAIEQLPLGHTNVDRPPAVKLRMTVTSGFYVRSLAHDLGEAMGSFACMSGLVRTRQGDYELEKNVLDFDDLDKGEDVWGPKVRQLIGASGEKGYKVGSENNHPGLGITSQEYPG